MSAVEIIQAPDRRVLRVQVRERAVQVVVGERKADDGAIAGPATASDGDPEWILSKILLAVFQLLRRALLQVRGECLVHVRHSSGGCNSVPHEALVYGGPERGDALGILSFARRDQQLHCSVELLILGMTARCVTEAIQIRLALAFELPSALRGG